MRKSTRLILLALLTACGGDVAPVIAPPPASLDLANGAAFPLLWVGQRVVLQGLGFGERQGNGLVEFSAAGGGTVTAPVDSAEWSDRFITTSVPDGAASGVIRVVTDGGTRLSLSAGIVSAPSFDPASLEWSPRTSLPAAGTGVAAAVGQRLDGSALRTFVFLAGGTAVGESTQVYVGFADDAGVIGDWQVRRALPDPRAHAALIVATPHSSRRGAGPALYIIGGANAAGEAISSVLAAGVTLPEASVGPWVSVATLPEALVAPRAVLANGNIYVTGGTDGAGRPSDATFVARIRADGALEGWFPGPTLPVPHAYHGAVPLDTQLAVFAGVADTLAAPLKLDTLSPRRADAAYTFVSGKSGFFTTALWVDQGAAFPAARSHLATLRAGPFVLAVGGLYPGVGESLAEALAAPIETAGLGTFGGPVGTNSIAALGGGVLVGATGVSWHAADGRAHGLVIGGVDLLTGAATGGVWGF